MLYFIFNFLVNAHALVTPGFGMIIGCTILEIYKDIITYFVNFIFSYLIEGNNYDFKNIKMRIYLVFIVGLSDIGVRRHHDL